MNRIKTPITLAASKLLSVNKLSWRIDRQRLRIVRRQQRDMTRGARSGGKGEYPHTASDGAISGTTTCRKVCHQLPPLVAEASSSSAPSTEDMSHYLIAHLNDGR